MSPALASSPHALYELGDVPELGAVPAKMLAQVIRAERFGEPRDAFREEPVQVPELGPRDVLVYVMAAGVNYNNVWAAMGIPVDVIKARQKKGEPEDFHVGGSDASGVVWAIGKDVTNVVDRIKLPMLAISSTDFSFNQERYTYHRAIDWLREAGKPGFESREKYEKGTVLGVSRGIPIDIGYTLIAWTMYLEDMNQILEQVITKFSPVAYISVRGVRWETIVKLDGIANNLETEPGDNQLRVIKFQFNLTAETYIPQPIRREKTVLKIKTEFVDGLSDDSITEVIGRLEVAVKELECEG